MTPEGAALFDSFVATAWRLETLPEYRVADEDDELAAWRAGRPRPEYSVRTSAWLARIATDTVAGKRWASVRVVDDPLTEYEHWQLVNYVEQQAVGQQIRVLDRRSCPDGARDMWLFDADTGSAAVIDMAYDGGVPGEHRLVRDPDVVRTFRDLWTACLVASRPLNDYLARASVSLTGA